jgi:hypothetical protein
MAPQGLSFAAARAESGLWTWPVDNADGCRGGKHWALGYGGQAAARRSAAGVRGVRHTPAQKPQTASTSRA